MLNTDRPREPIRRRRTESFILYDESSSPSADDYIIDADYPVEAYLKKIKLRAKR
jgi:hypothetical protein